MTMVQNPSGSWTRPRLGKRWGSGAYEATYVLQSPPRAQTGQARLMSSSAVGLCPSRQHSNSLLFMRLNRAVPTHHWFALTGLQEVSCRFRAGH